MSLNLALVISGNAAGLKQAATDSREHIRGMGEEARNVSASMTAANDQAAQSIRRVTEALTGQSTAQRMVNQLIAAGSPSSEASYHRRGEDIAAYGNELDRLRARYNPLFAVIRQYRQFQADIRRDHALGAISSAEYQTAMSRERQATLDTIAALKGRSQAMREAGGGMDAFGMSRRANLGYQMFDIGQSAALDMPIQMIAAQQLPQIAQLYAGQGGLNALWKDAAGLLVGMARAAGPWLVAGAAIYAGYQLIASYSAEAALRVDDATQALADQAMPVGTLKSAIGELASLQETYQSALANTGKVSDSVTAKIIANSQREFDARKALLELERIRQEAALKVNAAMIAQQGLKLQGDVADKVFSRPDPTQGGSYDPRIGKFAPTPYDLQTIEKTTAVLESNPAYQELKRLRAEGELTRIQFDALKEALDATFKDTSLIDGGTRAMERFRQSIEDTRPGLRDRQELGPYVGKRNNELFSVQAQHEADQLAAFARTNAEKQAAVEARIRARARLDGDSGGGLQARVGRALEAERNRQQIELRDTAQQRQRMMGESIAQQQLELALIGRTAGEQAALRFEYERMLEVRRQAAETGVPADEAEILLIREKAEEYRKYADAIARAQLGRDLQFERDQMFRSPIEQRVASRLQSAGLEVDLDSYEAGIIRANEQLREARELWQQIGDVGRNAIDGIFDVRSMDDFEDWLKSFGDEALKQFNQLALANPLKNAFYGDQLPTLDSVGGFGGFISALLGGQMPGAQSVGAMTVNAGTVVVSGAIGAQGGAQQMLDRIFNPANSNAAPAAASNAAPQWLSGIGSPNVAASYGGDLASNIKFLAKNIGADPLDLATLMSFESGFRPQIMGGAGGKYRGLIQMGPWEQQNYGLNANTSLGDQFGMIERFFKDRGFKPGMSGLDLYSTVNAGSPGRYGASDAANGGTWGSVRDKWQYQMDGHRDRAAALLGEKSSAAAKEIEKMAGQSAVAGQGLNEFGQGASAFGKNLQSFLSSAQGGGSDWFQGLMKMFGGAGGALGWMNSISPGATSAIVGGAIGLFDKGGHTGFGDPRDLAGFTHKDEFVFSAPAVKALGLARLDALHRAAKSGRGFAEGGSPMAIPAAAFGSSGRDGGGWGGRPNVIKFENRGTPQRLVEEREEDDGQGGRLTRYVLDDAVADSMSHPGSRAGRTMRAWGSRPPLVRT